MNKDMLGASLSVLCICHCILTPIILVFFGTGVITAIAGHEAVHWLFIGPVAIIVCLAFPSARRLHKQSLPTVLAVCGLAILILALLLHGWLESVLTVIGGSILVSAHLLNRHLLAKHNMTCS